MVIQCIYSMLLSHVFVLQQTLVLAPGDIVKVRLQCQTESKQGPTNMPKPKYRGPIHCLLSIMKEEGIRGLYRGAFPLMLRDGPAYAFYFFTYRTVCESLAVRGETRPSEYTVRLHSIYRKFNIWLNRQNISTHLRFLYLRPIPSGHSVKAGAMWTHSIFKEWTLSIQP